MQAVKRNVKQATQQLQLRNVSRSLYPNRILFRLHTEEFRLFDLSRTGLSIVADLYGKHLPCFTLEGNIRAPYVTPPSRFYVEDISFYDFRSEADS